jgi:hypothetical protein
MFVGDQPYVPDYFAVAQFCLSALKTMRQVLTPSEHQHLYATASRALATARRRGDDQKITFWGEQPVVSIEVAP